MDIKTTSSGHTVNYHQQQQNEIATPIGPPPVPRPPNLPRSHLLAGSFLSTPIHPRPAPNLPRLDLLTDILICKAFRRASLEGDWEAAEAILHQKPELIRSAITQDLDTPLHFAFYSPKSNKFVKNLVNLMDEEDLELQNKSYKTALCLAAAYGKVEIAKIMLEKNKSLLEIPDIEGMMPLHVAAFYGKRDMVRYLYDKSNKMNTDSWTPENQGWVLKTCVETYLFDVAVQIVNDHPELTSNKRLLADVLLVLAQNTHVLQKKQPHTIVKIIKSMFHGKVGHAEGESDDGLKLLRINKEKIASMSKHEIENILKGPPLGIGEGQHTKTTYPSRLLFVAVKSGNTRFVLELIQLYPDIILMVDDKGRSIFHHAVKHRDTEIYNMLHEIGPMKDIITHMEDVEGNNLLHFVGKSGKPKRFAHMPKVTIQMQQDLLWFKEVEKMVPSAYREKKNKQGETPQDLFTQRHDHLLIEGEKWVKDNAPFISVPIALASVSAYILFLVYNKRNTSLPFFYQKPAFIVSVIAFAISIIFSSTSVLLFLSILSTPFVEPHLVKSLLNKHLFGLATLFLSMVTMSVAGSAFLFLVISEELKWMPVMSAGFIGMTILLLFMEDRPLDDVFHLTYGFRNLFKSKKRKA